MISKRILLSSILCLTFIQVNAIGKKPNKHVFGETNRSNQNDDRGKQPSNQTYCDVPTYYIETNKVIPKRGRPRRNTDPQRNIQNNIFSRPPPTDYKGSLVVSQDGYRLEFQPESSTSQHRTSCFQTGPSTRLDYTSNVQAEPSTGQGSSSYINYENEKSVPFSTSYNVKKSMENEVYNLNPSSHGIQILNPKPLQIFDPRTMNYYNSSPSSSTRNRKRKQMQNSNKNTLRTDANISNIPYNTIDHCRYYGSKVLNLGTLQNLNHNTMNSNACLSGSNTSFRRIIPKLTSNKNTIRPNSSVPFNMENESSSNRVIKPKPIRIDHQNNIRPNPNIPFDIFSPQSSSNGVLKPILSQKFNHNILNPNSVIKSGFKSYKKAKQNSEESSSKKE